MRYDTMIRFHALHDFRRALFSKITLISILRFNTPNYFRLVLSPG